MNFIGCDLHKKTITMCVVNQNRVQLASRRFACTDTVGILLWLGRFRPFQLVVEATASYEWFAQLVEPLADRVVLAHPGKLRIIAESTNKSDKLDARVLAELLAAGMIPEAYRPTLRQREHRRLVRHRQYLRGRITSVRNRIRRILSDYNADRADLFTVRGRRACEAFKVSDADRFVMDQLWVEYDHHRAQLDEIEKAIRRFAESAPTAEAQARELLQTIPGVGFITTEVFLSEVADVRRFRSQKKVAAYAGLAPGQRESAGKRKELGITHAGSGMLRWALNQASWQLVRRDLKWRRIFEDLAKRRGKKRAITAVSRRLLCVMTAVVMNGRPYCVAA
jgi:transposase